MAHLTVLLQRKRRWGKTIARGGSGDGVPGLAVGFHVAPSGAWNNFGGKSINRSFLRNYKCGVFEKKCGSGLGWVSERDREELSHCEEGGRGPDYLKEGEKR